MAHASKAMERAEAAVSTETAGLYDRDFYAWAQCQAAAVRAGRFNEIDIKNLAEEIEDLGRAEFHKVESAFRVLLTHMLKWDHQPERRSRSWANSISAQRIAVEYLLKDNPALKVRVGDALERAFRQARLSASTEMKRSVSNLPADCPYSLDDILTRPFRWPGD